MLSYIDDIREALKTGHVRTIAVAGAGKTRMLESVCKTLHVSEYVYCAYTRMVAKEAKRRLPLSSVTTISGMGYSVVLSNLGYAPLKPKKYYFILYRMKGPLVPHMDRLAICALWEKVRLSGREPTAAVIRALIEHYGAEVTYSPEELEELFGEMAEEGYNTRKNGVDYTDMLWMPVYFKMKTPKHRYILVDEFQDLSPVQQSLVANVLAENALYVGDPNQSIFGFAGADYKCLSSMSDLFPATQFSMDVTWRCPHSHVTLAQKIVPRIVSREGAEEGTVEKVAQSRLHEHVLPGDLVLCRNNSPLIKATYGLLKNGVPAYVRGRDLCVQLCKIIDALRPAVLLAHVVERAKKVKKKAARSLFGFVPTGDTIQCLDMFVRTSKSNTYDGVRADIVRMFTPNSTAVVLSSVHRAKGLESRRVALLQPELIPSVHATKDWEMEQERNLMYIALTRSLSHLSFTVPE